MRAFLALPLAAFALAGCAKFPENGADNSFTRMLFRFRVAGPVSQAEASQYLYIVAIKVFRSTDSTNESSNPNGPIPVVTTGSKNGFVEGEPTHYVIYRLGGTTDTYEVHRFATKAEAPDPSDDNPINLGAQTQTGGTLFSLDPTAEGSDPQQFGFDITTKDLATNGDSADARTITGIQFNILTMNKDARTSVGDRVMDALGDSRGQGTTTFNDFRGGISLRTGNTYRNSTSTTQEREGDVYNAPSNQFPPIDIVDWTLEVRTQ